MYVSPFHYLPLTPSFFSIFVCALIALFIGLVGWICCATPT